MSDTTTTGSGLEQARRLGVETTGIEIIEESERTARPQDLFWPWFAANVSVFGISYGSFVLGFGISFLQALVVTVVGVVVSFALCGIIAIAGKRGSAPTMILSRAAFGVDGQKVPGVISWLVSIGWETFLAILAVLATATIFDQLGWASGTGTKVVATVVVAALIVSASVAGYHIIMRMQSVLTWITGIATIVYVLLTLDEIDWSAVSDIPSGSTQQMVGALVMVMTGFGLGWINIAADWSRYQHRDARGAAIVGWNTFGGAVAPVLLVVFGLLLAGSSGDLSGGIVADPIGTLGTLLPTWFLVPFLLAAILALVSGAVLGIYSSGLTLLSLGVRIPRPAAAFVDGVILTLGTIWVVFFAEDFLGPFQSFLITLGVPLAAWAGIMIADIALRKRDYDEAALFDVERPLRRVRLDVDRHARRCVRPRLGPGGQQLRRRRRVEQLAGLPARPARPRHLRRRPGRPLLGGPVGLRQPRRPARAGPRLRRDLCRAPRHRPAAGGLSDVVDLRAHAEELLAHNRYATLGTITPEGRPWTSPVYFAADDVTSYYWCSTTDSRHSVNLATNDAVSLVVFDSTVAPYTGRAVYAEGTAAAVADGDLAGALSVYPGPASRGGSALEVADVTGDSPWRLWRAVATSVWVLCPRERGRACELHGRSDDHRARVVP